MPHGDGGCFASETICLAASLPWPPTSSFAIPPSRRTAQAHKQIEAARVSSFQWLLYGATKPVSSLSSGSPLEADGPIKLPAVDGRSGAVPAPQLPDSRRVVVGAARAARLNDAPTTRRQHLANGFHLRRPAVQRGGGRTASEPPEGQQWRVPDVLPSLSAGIWLVSPAGGSAVAGPRCPHRRADPATKQPSTTSPPRPWLVPGPGDAEAAAAAGPPHKT